MQGADAGGVQSSRRYGQLRVAPMNIGDLEQRSLDELLGMLPQGGYTFRTGSGGWMQGAVEQTWDGDPRTIDRDDVLVFLRRHLAFLSGERRSEQDGDDCVVVDGEG